MRTINEIVVHCSATPEGRDVTVATIRKWHKQRGWKDIGYHFVVYLDGSIHKGRPVAQTGAHVAGRNSRTIGVCYIGGVARDGITPKDTRTPAQKRALRKLLTDLISEHPSITLVSGHHDYAAKACPSFPARAEYADLSKRKGAKSVQPAKADDRYRYLQKLLAMTGREFGLIDGIEGPLTIAAIKDYQTFMGLPVTGKFDKATVARLRELETPAKVVEKVPEKHVALVDGVAAEGRVSTTNLAAGVAGLTTITGMASQVADAVEDAQSAADGLFAASPWVVALCAGVAACAWIYRERQRYREKAKDAKAEAS